VLSGTSASTASLLPVISCFRTRPSNLRVGGIRGVHPIGSRGTAPYCLGPYRDRGAVLRACRCRSPQPLARQELQILVIPHHSRALVMSGCAIRVRASAPCFPCDSQGFAARAGRAAPDLGNPACSSGAVCSPRSKRRSPVLPPASECEHQRRACRRPSRAAAGPGQRLAEHQRIAAESFPPCPPGLNPMEYAFFAPRTGYCSDVYQSSRRRCADIHGSGDTAPCECGLDALTRSTARTRSPSCHGFSRN
jgi:hypothetical protein